MIPHMVGKIAPNSTHSTKGLVKYVSGRGYFCAVSYQNGDKFVTSPPPAPIVERVGGNNSGNISYFAVPWEAGGPSPLKPARL